jgi:UDP-N-acetylmuramoylalanine--D-glutamate ligase
MKSWIADADRLSPWPEATVVVAGFGASGFAAADGLLSLNVGTIIVLDDAETPAKTAQAELLRHLGVDVRLGAGASAELPADADLVVTSPGWPPTAPLLAQAVARGVPIWGEVELAWRMMQPDRVVPWLGVTGTNGKTTTTLMLASMLSADGLRTDAVGNVGRPIIEALLDEIDYDVLGRGVVELPVALGPFAATALRCRAQPAPRSP